MKNLIFTTVFAFLLAASSALTAQNHPDEYLGLPGDNLNLFAVMNLFQDSETLEAFERSLNDPEIMINNLDLNGDNYVDYIMVHDYVEGSVHSIVLRVALSENELQDVAVFTVEKFRNGSVLVQLIGDEALYGPNYIVEPNYAERANPGYRGNVQQQAATQANVKVVHTTYYEVASWPVIVYLSRPSYRPWRSAWYWGYTPTYWEPWTPYYYHYYYGYHYNSYSHYYTYYRPWHRPRSVRYKTVYYTKIRNYSPTVVVNVNRGVYKNTYSRPESRREGEVLYSQRKAVGGTVSTRRSDVNQGDAVSRSRTAPDGNARVARPAKTGDTPAVSSPRSSAASSRNTESTRKENQSVNSNRERTVNTPARQNTTTTAPRPADQSARSRTATPETRERPSAPAQKVEQPSSRTNRAATRTAPASTNRPETRTAPAKSNRSETRTAPARSNRTETRTAPARSNRTETRTAPASTSRSESKSSRVTKPQTSRSSQPAKNVKSAEPKRPSRNSGTSVQKDKSRTQRSSTPAKSGRTPSRSGSSRSPNK